MNSSAALNVFDASAPFLALKSLVTSKFFLTTKFFLMISFVLLMLSVSGSTYPQQQAEDPLIGVWQGTVHHPKIGDVEFYFTIAKKETNSYMGKVDIPAQKARDIPMNAVLFDAPDLTLDISSFGIVFEGTLAPDFSRIKGELKVGDEGLPLELKRSVGVPEARRPQEPEKPYPYEDVEVRFANREADINLSGTLTLPNEQGPFPAAILISGSGPQDRDSTLAGHRTFLVLSDYLTRRGIAVLRYDDRGVMRSEGDFHKATTADFATDAQAAYAFLQNHPRIDNRAIGLVGHSEGALIGTMVAAKNPELAFLVLLAGTGVPGEQLAHMQSQEISRSHGVGEEAIRKETRMNEKLFQVIKTQKDPQLAEKEMRRIITDSLDDMSDAEKKELNVSEESLVKTIKEYLADYPWARFFMTYDPATDLRKVHCAVLALNGTKDTQVPVDVNLGGIEQALRQGGNGNYKIEKLAGVNHLFQTAKTGHPREYGKIDETFAPSALKIIGDWILETAMK